MIHPWQFSRPGLSPWLKGRFGQRRGLKELRNAGRPWGPRALLWALLLVLLSQAPLGAGKESGPFLEDLRYRVDAWVIQDAARARITLKSLGPNRYLAEISGEARGLVSLLSGQRRDTFQTEMVCRDGKLMPLVYREESRRRGRRHLKEYRFLYSQEKLELWQLKEGKGLALKWQTPLKEPVFDALSAFYNFRLGALGPWKPGDTLRLTGIPYPEPEEMEVRLGPETREGHLVMVSLVNRAFKNQKGLIYVQFDGRRAPTQAWTQVPIFGKITGELLPGSKSLEGQLGILR